MTRDEINEARKQLKTLGLEISKLCLERNELAQKVAEATCPVAVGDIIESVDSRRIPHQRDRKNFTKRARVLEIDKEQEWSYEDPELAEWTWKIKVQILKVDGTDSLVMPKWIRGPILRWNKVV